MDPAKIIQDLKAHGLTQEGIAIAIGVTQPSISGVATGATKRPSFMLISRLIELRDKLNAEAVEKVSQ